MPRKRTSQQSSQQLGEAQLEVLQYIADHHPIRVSEVAEHFLATQGKARTTILTVMEKLREKGFLRRRKKKGAYEYSPVSPKSEILSGVVGKFVDGSLGGSVSPLIAYLVDSRSLSDSELRELESLVKELNTSATNRKPERRDD